MQLFTSKHKLRVITILVLVMGLLVPLACRSFTFEPTQENGPAKDKEIVNIESKEFVNRDLVPENPLYIPPLLDLHIENGEKVFELAVQAGEVEFFKGKHTKTLGFNGNYLGPTLRAHAGDKVRLNVTNDLDEATTVHWHGMHLPVAMDGGPYQVINPGETWQPYWTIDNEAATLWYHPHLMGKTGEQVYRGLAGFFLIDDKNSDALALPKEYGVDDIPLVIQDRQFDGNAQFIYRHVKNTLTAGMLGDTILVNGTRAPYLEVPAKLIRLGLLNGSNARRYNFGFSDDRIFYQIASDGGLLQAPVERTRLLLAPGERAEILVNLSNTEKPLMFISYGFVDSGNPIKNSVQESLLGGTDEGQQFKVLELRPQTGNFASQEIPTTFNTIHRFSETDAVRTRKFVLAAFTINSKMMDHSRVDEIVKMGDTEIWEVSNNSPTYHPFHIHGVQFLILDRDGKEPPAYEQGWKDTVVVLPQETVRLIMQFKDFSDPSLPYMYHCHILEHEDMGMMGQFVVVQNPSDDVHFQSPLHEPMMDHNANH